MKRIESLIEKLNIQVAQKASLGQLLVTIQMLQKEITGTMKEIEVLGTSGISVIAPVAPAMLNGAGPANRMDTARSEKEYFELVIETADEDEPAAEINSTPIPTYEEVIRHQKQEKLKESSFQPPLNFAGITNTVADELPTLARQPRPATRATKQAASPKASRNAVKDLKKAINNHDKLLFTKELFRNDDAAFERSIKTINNFTTLTEAEFWIMRELKTKNGWLPGNPVVQQFDDLIKRRFA